MSRKNKLRRLDKKIIGLIPASGLATRLGTIPCSKELYPIGFRKVNNSPRLSPKVVCHYLLEKMRVADITQAYIVLRSGKWDIPTYFLDGSMLNMNLSYLIMNLPFGVPYTVDQAFPFVENAIVAFGFPDILFKPENAFKSLLSQLVSSNADVVLGLFPVHKPQKWDMVELNDEGKIKQITKKPLKSDLRYTWVIAVWTPVFTNFMHEYLISREAELSEKFHKSNPEELVMSDIMQQALINNIQIGKVLFPYNTCLDIGTPEDLKKALDEQG